MQANLTSLLSWVSMEALNTPEPVVLLVLGGLFLVLSFRVRSRPNVAKSQRCRVQSQVPYARSAAPVQPS